MKTYRIFANKFTVGQRVKNIHTGLVGTVEEVDPNSFNPPAGRAVHNPYRVQFDHWPTGQSVWEPENELEAVTDKPKRKFNPAWPSAQRDAESGARKARSAKRWVRFAEVTGYASPAVLVKAMQAGEAGLVRNGETIGDRLVWIDNETVKLIEK